MIKTGFSGAQYFTKGFQLVKTKGIRHFVILPLLVNFIMLASASVWLFSKLIDWKESLYNNAWGWVQWILDNLGWLIWPILFICIFLGVFYFFAIIANWLAAPFNALLSEAVEKHLAGDAYVEPAGGFSQFMKDMPRLFGREWHKFKYWLPKALGCLLLFLIPGIAFIAPIVWLLFSAWMLAVQYIDYPMDNHKVPFYDMLAKLRASRGGPMGFGGMVMLFTLIPIVNILVMPVAVAGATALWYDQYRD